MNNKEYDLVQEVKEATGDNVVFARETEDGKHVIYGKQQSQAPAVSINGMQFPLVFSRKERRKMLADQKRLLKKAFKQSKRIGR